MPGPTLIFWCDEPDGNVVEHVREHGIEPEEAEEVLKKYFDQREPSRAKTGRWVVQGYTAAGRYLMVVFDFYEDEDLADMVTAFEPSKGA